MKISTSHLLHGAIILGSFGVVAVVNAAGPASFDAAKFRFKLDSSSVFKNKDAQEIERLNSLLDSQNSKGASRANEFRNPEPELSLPASDILGDIEAPDGELWSYVGKFEYIEIPPHDNVMFTERLLQEYTFTIYDGEMNEVGTIKDKIHYQNGEKRAPLCEITPVITRNFFNTNDDIEVMVAVGINPANAYGVHYHSYVYTLGGEKDDSGYDLPIMEINSLMGDAVEGPRTADGKDNFYFTFQGGSGFEIHNGETAGEREPVRYSGLNIFGRALDATGPRFLMGYSVPVQQLPGDQENVPPMISVRRGEDVYFMMQKYKEPFYNPYQNIMTDDLTQREGNSLVVEIFKAKGDGVEQISTTEIPVVLDQMINSQGQPTSLFSYFSVGNLRYGGDILFDAPGTEEGKPDFIVTRSNYVPSTDGMVYSFFTYKNDGSLKNTLCLYSIGSRAMGDIEGFEPQQMFLQSDSFGYRYRFVDLYSARTAAMIDANYYYEEDSESELLSTNCDRTPNGDSYLYAFELRYPLVDDDENDILRFMYLNADGKYNHIDYVNMGKGVAYAQSYLSTEALRRNAYTEFDTPAYMLLIKRGVEGSLVKIEQLMVAEAMSEDKPEGNTLLLLGPKDDRVLTSIVPEFPEGERKGHLFVYYYDYPKSQLSLDIYGLPIKNEIGGVEDIPGFDGDLLISGDFVRAEGEIRIYSTDGVLVSSGRDEADLSGLAKGIYIVRAKGVSRKISK